MEIKVLGADCAKCKKLEESVRQAVQEMNIDAEIVKVEDITEIMSYGILQTPGLVVDGKVIHSGRIALKKEIIRLLTPFIS